MTTDDEIRDFATRLFADPDAPAEPDDVPEPPDPTKGNVAPREGNNPTPPAGDQDMREFARRLFDGPQF